MNANVGRGIVHERPVWCDNGWEDFGTPDWLTVWITGNSDFRLLAIGTESDATLIESDIATEGKPH